jgi:hypothetical protein
MTLNVTVTINAEANDLDDLLAQINTAVTSFRGENEVAPAAPAAARRPRRAAAAAPEASAGDDTGNGGVDPAALADAEGLGGDGARADFTVAADAPARRGRPPGKRNGAAPEDPQAGSDGEGGQSLPFEGAGQDAEQVGERRREPASLAEIQALAKSLGAQEGAGVAAVQAIFAKHGVKTPRDIDDRKLEALRADFEAELAT